MAVNLKRHELRIKRVVKEVLAKINSGCSIVNAIQKILTVNLRFRYLHKNCLDLFR